MIELRQPFNKLAAVLLMLYSLAHLLATVSLVAFGLLVGGYPLNRWSIYGYAGAAATALVLSLQALRQRDDRPNALLLTLPPLLSLWMMGLYATTEVLSAEFAPYLDDVNKLFFAFNLAYALLGCWLALAYHWPRLLVVWAAGQGVLLLINPGLWVMLLRHRFAPPLMGLWLASLAYALTAPALGYRVPWRRALKWLWPFALAGMGMAAYAFVTILGREWYGEREALLWVAGLTVLGSLLTTGLILGLPFHAWHIGRTWPGEGLARRPSRWAWVAFLVILFLMSGASAGQLRVGDGGLPAPMEVQRWGPTERVVPDAYLPTITWARWLFSALRWLLIPAALLILWEAWRKRAERPVRAGVRWNEFPRLLLWPALASTGIFITLIYPLNKLSFVLGVAWGDRMGLLRGLSPLLTSLGLLWLYRLWEQEWSQRMRTLWALLTAGLLALYAVWQVQALIAYGRVLFAPLPAWETSWEYAPIDPILMATIRLILHVALLALGLWAMVRTVRETWRPEGRFALPRQLLWRGLGLALITVLLLGAGWYWWAKPGIVRTVPPNGATDVSRDTRILIEFRQDARPWGMGWGMHTRYADTGDYIPGGTGGSPGGMRFDPEGLLRPNAPVEITVYREGRRPYVLRFTTAGVDSPTATPLPPGERIGPETPAPVPTEAPAATSTPVTPAPAYLTREAARQATIVARATASPFPTAGPAAVQTGQPAGATTQRDGLSFQVRLPKDTYLAGEGGQAEVILRNDGPETVFIRGGLTLFGLVLLDEQGHDPAPWPWSSMLLRSTPLHLQKLAPGQAIAETIVFQVPPAEQAAGHTYDLWAETRFSRPDPNSPEGPDNLWLRLETGEIPLQVTPPGPTQRLMAQLQADQDGWHLQVTDPTGQALAGRMWGMMEAASSHSATARRLEDSADGTWSGAWDAHMRDGEEIIVQAWAAAPGYVTAAVTQTVPGEGDARRMFGAESPMRQTFATLAAAQAALDFPLYRPGHLPAGAVLDKVQVETRADRDCRWTDISQIYRLLDGAWLELRQMVTTEHYASAGWGRARYEWEARLVTVGQTTGYVVQRFGWWVLDWKVGDVGFELQAPAQAVSLNELLAIAASVQLSGEEEEK